MDGLALGRELAATRVKALGLTDLARRLEERLVTISTANRLAPARHRTMGVLVDWSYDLLAVPERTLLHRVAIFAGGWTIESAERVCAAPRFEAGQIADVLGRLVDKSLVVVERGSAHPRYRLLESIREYAIAKLADAGECSVFARRHAEYVADFAESEVVSRATTPRRIFLQNIASEEDNARALSDGPLMRRALKLWPLGSPWR